MSSDDDSVVLKVKNISKCFEIYEKPVHRLYQTLCAGYKKFYKEFWALKNIDLEVRKGDCIGIIGRNGAGKSTLLQIITGTLQATSGQVESHGRIAALLELGSGFNPEFTGRENVFMNAAVLGLTAEEINRKYPQIVEFADIGDFIDQPVKTYSSGMVLRLAFAVIANVEADILIVDEALAVGDVFFTQKCMRFIREFKKKHTILFVSHDTAAVQSLCNKAVLLQRGHIVFTGETKGAVDLYLKECYGEIQEVGCRFLKKNEKLNLDKKENTEILTTENDIFKHGTHSKLCFYDMRRDFLNRSNLRNDIQVFQFTLPSDEKKFGTGLVSIDSVILEDSKGRPLSYVVGGEWVRLKIHCVSQIDLLSPVVGFILKDRNGQDLFVENTYIPYMAIGFPVKAGECFSGIFEFSMPVLARGDYSFSCAVANGSQKEHIQHQWINDALIVKSMSTYALGVVGLNIDKIVLCKDGEDADA